MSTFYENSSAYLASLKLNLDSSILNINNPLGGSCNISFDDLGGLNFDLIKMDLQPSPLNFKFFNKMTQASEIVNDFNNIIIRLIEDLKCCELADKYNNSIVPLFLWFVGDAGNQFSNPDQYDEWRKTGGFIPILVKIIEEILKGYEFLKNLLCLIRPVPGNPWLGAGGYDFYKSIYGMVSELDFIVKMILDGDYIDPLLNKAKKYRDDLIQCAKINTNEISANMYDPVSDVNIKSQLSTSLSQEAIIVTDDSTIKELQNKLNDLIFLKKIYDKILVVEVNKNLNIFELYDNSSILTDIRISANDDDETGSAYTEYGLNPVEVDFLFNNEIVKFENGQAYFSSLDTFILEINKIKDEIAKTKTAIFKNQNIIDAYLKNKNKYAGKIDTNCKLMTDVLRDQEVKKVACHCFASIIDLYIPLIELQTFKNTADLESRIYGRILWSEKDKYTKDRNDPSLAIKSSNINNKLTEAPFTFNSSWRTKYTGVDPDILIEIGGNNSIAASGFYNEMDSAKTPLEAAAFGDKITKYLKLNLNNQAKSRTNYTNIYFEIKKILELELQEINKELVSINLLAILQDKKIDNTYKIKKIEVINNILKNLDEITIYNLDKDLLKDYSEIYNNISALQTQFKNEYDTFLNHQKHYNYLNKILELNTRNITLLDKNTLPCDCLIICKLIQYFVDLIISYINKIIEAIVANLLDSLLTKEMKYIAKAIKSKLKCVIDILEIPENIKKIKAAADGLIESNQNLIKYANEPVYCTSTSSSDLNTSGSNFIPISPSTNAAIYETLINFTNQLQDEYGEHIYNENNQDDTLNNDVYPYPNTDTTQPTDVSENDLNQNTLIIENLEIGEEYEFRNIPTLIFDCEKYTPQIRPKFDIFIDKIPTNWSMYFSFMVDENALNNFENISLTTELNSNENLLKSMVIEQLELTEDQLNPLIYNQDDINKIISDSLLVTADKVKEILDTKVTECTPSEVYEESSELDPCYYKTLEIIDISLINPTVNLDSLTFSQDTDNVYIDIKSNITRFFNIPILIKVKKIFDERSTIVYEEYADEVTSVILLLDIFNINDIDELSRSGYIGKPENDINLLYGRYPYLEIGFKDSISDVFYLNGYEAKSFLDKTTILEFCDKAIKNKKLIDLNTYKPTDEQIAKLKEENEDKWKEQNCYLPPESKQIINNVSLLLTDTIIPLVDDLKYESDKVLEFANNNTQIIDLEAIKAKLKNNTYTTDYGLPLIELNEYRDICIQIVKTKGADNELVPMINIANFNFLSNFINLNDENNIQMIIEPGQVYFMSIVFDGTQYTFTLINEEKATASIKKLKVSTDVLFPKRIGRMTNSKLQDYTFCGTIFDVGFTNTVINPADYYKYSLLQYNPKTDVFINFENNIFNNFYSTSDLPTSLLKPELTEEQKYHLEQVYLKDPTSYTGIPYFIFNKYITAQPMDRNISLVNNTFKQCLINSFITNFFCKESIKNKSFTMSFWLKRFDNELIVTNKERMVLISDTKYFNTIYYNNVDNSINLEFAENYNIKLGYSISLDTWYQFVMKFDHISNTLSLYLNNINNSVTTLIYKQKLPKQFNFNLISLLAEFDFTKKDFTNYFVCAIGNMILDLKVIKDDILLKQFLNQKLSFRGL